MNVLELRGISGGYGSKDILHDVSLSVGVAEIVVIIGPNGAGKSTAMKAVFGLLTLHSGQVWLNQLNITGMSPEQVVRHGVCYVPQVENVFLNLTVEENLELGAYIRSDDFRPRIQQIYTMFAPLAAKRRQPAGSLSGGQRQMLAIGKALMLEPKILFLDEPTAGLSPLFRSQIFTIVRTINATGVAVLMVEQNARQALAIADRGYVLVDGSNRLDGSGAELLAHREIAELFLGGGR